MDSQTQIHSRNEFEFTPDPLAKALKYYLQVKMDE